MCSEPRGVRRGGRGAGGWPSGVGEGERSSSESAAALTTTLVLRHCPCAHSVLPELACRFAPARRTFRPACLQSSSANKRKKSDVGKILSLTGRAFPLVRRCCSRTARAASRSTRSEGPFHAAGQRPSVHERAPTVLGPLGAACSAGVEAPGGDSGGISGKGGTGTAGSASTTASSGSSATGGGRTGNDGGAAAAGGKGTAGVGDRHGRDRKNGRVRCRERGGQQRFGCSAVRRLRPRLFAASQRHGRRERRADSLPTRLTCRCRCRAASMGTEALLQRRSVRTEALSARLGSGHCTARYEC
jgi:hypothetical protein